MALTPAQLAARDGKLTGSVVGCLMTGDHGKQMALWRSLVGDPSYKPDDLRAVWPVQLGTVTEELNLDWYERTTRHEVTRRGEVAVHPDVAWAAATLDGWDAHLGIPVETKHVGGYEPRATIIARYRPQCMWQMIVTQAAQCALSIIEGARKPAVEMIGYDADYARTLWLCAENFMQHVWAMTPPTATESQ